MNDYLIHYNHNHDKLGRFARSAGSASSAVGRKLSSRKEKTNATRKYESNKRLGSKKIKANNVEVAKNKQKGSKSNNTKLSDAERRRLVEHGSAKEVTKNKDRLSNRELEAAITRLQKENSTRADLERKLSDLNNPVNEKNAKSFVDKMSDLGTTLNKATTAVDQGVKAYNMMAKIHNAKSPDKWVIVGENNDKNNILKMQKVVMTGTMTDVWKNKSNMTPQQYKNAVERFKTDNELKSMMDEAKSSKSSSSNNDQSSSYKPFFQENPQPKPESWADVRSNKKKSNNNIADDILDKYPEREIGETQRMSEEELRKRYRDR